MNISENSRFKSTEENIEKALFSLLKIRKYDDIYVKEICYEAGINRSSFYTHYQDINDLMCKTEAQLSKEIKELLSESNIEPIEKYNKLFKFLLSKKPFYTAYLCNARYVSMERNDFVAYLQDYDAVPKNIGQSDEQRQYSMTFFAGGLKAIAKMWLLSGCRQSTEQMAGYTIRYVKDC